MVYNHHTHHSSLVVNLPKTIHSQRIVPLHRLVENKLSCQYRKSEEDNTRFVFSNSSTPLHPNMLRKHYQHILRQLGLPILRFHALRHTFATQCIEAGSDIKTLSAILGHSNVQTTFNLYVHPSMEQKQRCLDNMMERIMSMDIK